MITLVRVYNTVVVLSLLLAVVVVVAVIVVVIHLQQQLLLLLSLLQHPDTTTTLRTVFQFNNKKICDLHWHDCWIRSVYIDQFPSCPQSEANNYLFVYIPIFTLFSNRLPLFGSFQTSQLHTN